MRSMAVLVLAFLGVVGGQEGGRDLRGRQLVLINPQYAFGGVQAPRQAFPLVQEPLQYGYVLHSHLNRFLLFLLHFLLRHLLIFFAPSSPLSSSSYFPLSSFHTDLNSCYFLQFATPSSHLPRWSRSAFSTTRKPPRKLLDPTSAAPARPRHCLEGWFRFW